MLHVTFQNSNLKLHVAYQDNFMSKPLKKRVEVRKRVQKRRAKLRALGFRPIQIWVPDTRKKSFAKECRRQSLLLQNDPHEKEMMEWWESAADHEGWKA